jgi:hypothetical protein
VTGFSRRTLNRVDHDEIVRLYGPWRRQTARDAVELMRRYEGRWWIAGGWAIEAFTGIRREHADIDLGIFRSEAPLLRRHVRGRLDVWAADAGTLTPVIGEVAGIPPACRNLWLRPGGGDPWEYDVLLTDVVSDEWVYKRDTRVSLPVDGILWHRHGVDYLRPEVQLLYKAPGLRPQDQQDFESCLPLLGDSATSWLRAALETAHPGHPWITELV